MRKRKRVTISEIQKKTGFVVPKSRLLKEYFPDKPRKRTAKDFARKLLADEIKATRKNLGEFSERDPRHRMTKGANTVLRLLKSKKIRQVYQEAMQEKFGRGLTGISLLGGNLVVFRSLAILKKNRGFRTYDLTAENILKDPKTRTEFKRILSTLTGEGPGIERPGHAKMIYTLLLRRNNPIIIDVGISEGVSAKALADFFRKKKKRAKIIGIDILRQKKATERAKKAGFQFVEKDIIKAPVIPRGKPKADLIRASRVLRYMTRNEQRKAIKNMLADLKVDGYLYIPSYLYRKISASIVEIVPRKA